MIKVILGALAGAILGLIIGYIPGYHYTVVISQSSGHTSVPLANLLQPLSMIIGTSVGCLVGALAGKAAADKK